MDDLSSQKATLQRIAGDLQSRYPEIPADISRMLQEVQQSLQSEEEKVPGKMSPRSDSRHPTNVAKQSVHTFSAHEEE